MTLELRSRGRRFNSPSAHNQLIITWIGDCLWTDKPFRYNQHWDQLSLLSLLGKYQPVRLGYDRTCSHVSSGR